MVRGLTFRNKGLLVAASALGCIASVGGRDQAAGENVIPNGGITNRTRVQTEGRRAEGVSAAAATLVPLHIRLPAPPMGSAIVNIQTNQHLAPPSTRSRPPLMVPPGTTNLALHRPVRCSDRSLAERFLTHLTDGATAHEDRETVLVLHPGAQWVQVDLGQRHPLYAVVVWHSLWPPKVVHGVVVQIADDAAFTENVRTIFNND